MSNNQKNKQLTGFVFRGVKAKCEKLVNKHRNAYHIIYVFGNYFIVTTKHYQQSLKVFCEDPKHEMLLVKTQWYYDGSPIKPKQYRPQKTNLFKLIKSTDIMIKYREGIDLFTKEGRIKERALRKPIRKNIREIKRRLKGAKIDG